MTNSYIAPNGKLYTDCLRFFKASILIDGIGVTELWCDAYQLNIKKGNEILFPAEMCSPYPFEVTQHIENKNTFIEKGGGFRLDWNYNI